MVCNLRGYFTFVLGTVASGVINMPAQAYFSKRGAVASMVNFTLARFTLLMYLGGAYG